MKLPDESEKFLAKADEDKYEWVPPDGGYAWLVLFGAMLVNILIPGGAIKSFGILFVEFLENMNASPTAASWTPQLSTHRRERQTCLPFLTRQHHILRRTFIKVRLIPTRTFHQRLVQQTTFILIIIQATTLSIPWKQKLRYSRYKFQKIKIALKYIRRHTKKSSRNLVNAH